MIQSPLFSTLQLILTDFKFDNFIYEVTSIIRLRHHFFEFEPCESIDGTPQEVEDTHHHDGRW